MERQDVVWQGASLVHTFVNDVRGGVPYAADQIEMMLRVLAARGLPVRSFADLGCGSGVLARALLTRFPQARAALVDFSEPMLAEARRELGEHEPAPRFAVADLASTSWGDALRDLAPFDAIVSGYAIHHLTHERKRALYAEIFALLVPGGMFVNVEHVASGTPWIETISDELMVDSMFAFHQQRGGGKARAQVADEFVHRPDKAANILAPVEQQCEWLRAIGFADVDCFFKVFELAVIGGRKPQESPLAETMTTPRLLLRPPRLEDAEAIFRGWSSDAEVTRYLMWTPHTSVHQTVEFLQRCASRDHPVVGIPWLITGRDDGGILGMIDLRLDGSRAEIGYVLRRSAWGNGYMTEAVRAVIAAAFAVATIRRVWATCDVENTASGRVLEKAGMQREGVLRRYAVHPNISSEPRDGYLYAATR